MQRENGKPPTAKGEKGKPWDSDFHPDLTSHRHRAHARTHDTKRNNFPLCPPSSDLSKANRTSISASRKHYTYKTTQLIKCTMQPRIYANALFSFRETNKKRSLCLPPVFKKQRETISCWLKSKNAGMIQSSWIKAYCRAS